MAKGSKLGLAIIGNVLITLILVATQISMNLLSNQLSSGTYNISVYWRSIRNPVGTNSLQTFMYDSINTKYYNYVRTIWAQELR